MSSAAQHLSFAGTLTAAPNTELSGIMTLLVVPSPSSNEASVGGSWTTSDGSGGGLSGFLDCPTGQLRPCAASPRLGGLCATIMSADGPLPNAGVFSGTLNSTVGAGMWRIDVASVLEVPDAGTVSVHGSGTWAAD
jgi:hypothetical protein